jgi:hypothetical protein
MSIENHPNIYAAGFTSDIISAYVNRLRGKAVGNTNIALPILNKRIVDFVASLSEDLDRELGT